MNVSILLVTHGEIGLALLHQAREILDDPLEGLQSLAIKAKQGISFNDLGRAVVEADRGAGVLVITDLPGATPSNMAVQSCVATACNVITGLNLPMLIRAWNYRDHPLEELRDLAIKGGRAGIAVLR